MMPLEIFLYSFVNPYTHQKFDVFAPDYETAIVELGTFTEYSGICVLVTTQKVDEDDLQEL